MRPGRNALQETEQREGGKEGGRWRGMPEPSRIDGSSGQLQPGEILKLNKQGREKIDFNCLSYLKGEQSALSAKAPVRKEKKLRT